MNLSILDGKIAALLLGLSLGAPAAAQALKTTDRIVDGSIAAATVSNDGDRALEGTLLIELDAGGRKELAAIRVKVEPMGATKIVIDVGSITDDADPVGIRILGSITDGADPIPT